METSGVDIIKTIIQNKVDIISAYNFEKTHFLVPNNLQNIEIFNAIFETVGAKFETHDEISCDHLYTINVPGALQTYDQLFLVKLFKSLCPEIIFSVYLTSSETKLDSDYHYKINILPKNEEFEKLFNDLEDLGFIDTFGFSKTYEIDEIITIWQTQIDKEINDSINQNLSQRSSDEYESDDDWSDSEDLNFRSDGYEKYGGYNGWSDNDIDEAFEGDPEATWNVD